MPVFLKSSGDATRLQREAVVLGHVAYPDVVEVESFRAEEAVAHLTLIRVEGTTLADAQRPAPGDALALFGTLAATLAHVHARGVAHTRIDASHVILRHSGRPVLCGFADATPMPQDDDSLALADVVDLGHLMKALSPDPLARLRNQSESKDSEDEAATGRLAELSRKAINGELTAAQLCEQLRIEPSIRRATLSRPRRFRIRRLATVAGAIVVAGVLSVLVTQTSGDAGSADASAPTTTTTPPRAGLLSFGDETFSLAGAEDQAVLAKWNCEGPLPVLLRRKDGTVWLFSSWPDPAREVSGRQVAGVSGASSISLVPEGNCDRLELTNADGTKRILDSKELS